MLDYFMTFRTVCVWQKNQFQLKCPHTSFIWALNHNLSTLWSSGDTWACPSGSWRLWHVFERSLKATEWTFEVGLFCHSLCVLSTQSSVRMGGYRQALLSNTVSSLMLPLWDTKVRNSTQSGLTQNLKSIKNDFYCLTSCCFRVEESYQLTYSESQLTEKLGIELVSN